MKHPEQEELLAQTYDELESDLQKKIEGIGHQIDMLSDKRNTIIQVNRVAKTAMEVFHDILEKNKLEHRDLELIIRQIKVYEDHLEIQLQADVDAILRSGTLPEGGEAVAAMARQGDTVNFKGGMEHISPVTIVQAAKNRPDKVFHANVINDGEAALDFTLPSRVREFFLLTAGIRVSAGVTMELSGLFGLTIHGERYCVLGEFWREADGDQLLLRPGEETIWYYAHEQDTVKRLCGDMTELLEKHLAGYLSEH